MKKIRSTALLLLTTFSAYAQIYTLPDGAPLLLNPALTGMHNGALRVNTVYNPYQLGPEREWRGITTTTSTDYRTKSWGKGRQHAGIGALYTYDGFTTNAYYSQKMLLSAAWHIHSRQNNRHLSLGAEAGTERHSFYVYDQLAGNSSGIAERKQIRARHMGIGLSFVQQVTKSVRYIAGAHITSLQPASDAETKKYTANQYTPLHIRHLLAAK